MTTRGTKSDIFPDLAPPTPHSVTRRRHRTRVMQRVLRVTVIVGLTIAGTILAAAIV